MSLLTIVLFSSVKAQAQQTKVPEKVKTEFKKLYPDVKSVKWEMEKDNYEGKFSMDRKEMSVQVNDKGGLIQTETYLKVTELPKAAQSYLTKHYAGVKFDKASEVTDAKKVKHFQAETKDKTIMFDANGKFIKEEKGD